MASDGLTDGVAGFDEAISSGWSFLVLTFRIDVSSLRSNLLRDCSVAAPLISKLSISLDTSSRKSDSSSLILNLLQNLV